MRMFHYGILIVILILSNSLSIADNTTIELSVYKNQQCGCCGKWIEHLQDLGFNVDAHDQEISELNAIKDKHGITPPYRSCHTGVYQGEYVFEGHIPAKFIAQFILEKPEGAIGLTVPGMPVGSPGMEVDNKFSPYDILLIKSDGTYEVYAHIENYEAQF